MTDDALEASLEMHDELVSRRGVEVWIGAEPTFTRADSLDAAWLSAPQGDDKLTRAHAVQDRRPPERVRLLALRVGRIG